MKHTDEEYIKIRTCVNIWTVYYYVCNFLININFSTKIFTKAPYKISDMTCRDVQQSVDVKHCFSLFKKVVSKACECIAYTCRTMKELADVKCIPYYLHKAVFASACQNLPVLAEVWKHLPAWNCISYYLRTIWQCMPGFAYAWRSMEVSADVKLYFLLLEKYLSKCARTSLFLPRKNLQTSESVYYNIQYKLIASTLIIFF